MSGVVGLTDAASRGLFESGCGAPGDLEDGCGMDLSDALAHRPSSPDEHMHFGSGWESHVGLPSPMEPLVGREAGTGQEEDMEDWLSPAEPVSPAPAQCPKLAASPPPW